MLKFAVFVLSVSWLAGFVGLHTGWILALWLALLLDATEGVHTR